MEWLKSLSEIGIPTIIAVLVGLFGFIKGFETICKWVKNKFLYFYNRKKNNDTFQTTVDKHEKDICDIKESQIAISNGMQILLKDNLKKLHKEYMEDGNITSDELDDFTFQYSTYHSLGGNGTGTKWYTDVMSLPVVD